MMDKIKNKSRFEKIFVRLEQYTQKLAKENLVKKCECIVLVEQYRQLKEKHKNLWKKNL